MLRQLMKELPLKTLLNGEDKSMSMVAIIHFWADLTIQQGRESSAY